MNGMSQKIESKPIVYFLADTLSVDKNNRVIEIGKASKTNTYYAFFCRCVSPYQLYPMFIARNEQFRPEVSKTLPLGRYLSWQELSDLLSKHGNKFVEEYKFIIVEKLPNETYQTIEKLTWVLRKPLTTLQ